MREFISYNGTFRSRDRTRICDNNVRRQLHCLSHVPVDQIRIDSRKAILDLDVTFFDPIQIAHAQPECPDAGFLERIVFFEAN